MPFTLHEHDHADVLTLHRRFLGGIERGAIHDATDALLAAGRTKVVVDLSEVDFMDSTAIGLLIGCAKRLREAGGDLRLAALQDRIMNLFLATRLLGSAFEDYPDVAGALYSFTAEAEAAASAMATQA
jgi:anti-sigma B factor antagonist